MMEPLLIIIFVAVIAIGLGLLIVISLTRRPGKVLDQQKYRSAWLEITQHMEDSSRSRQFAVLSADSLLDKALKERGVVGETMGERLKHASPHLSSINKVWVAHKIRNKIAHESDVTITKRQASQALQIFKNALKDLGAL